MVSTMYAPQRVNFKPPAPQGAGDLTDPKKVLLDALKKLMEKSQQKIMNQGPAAVMGAVTNPSDVAKGMKGGVLGGIEVRAKMMGGQ